MRCEGLDTGPLQEPPLCSACSGWEIDKLGADCPECRGMDPAEEQQHQKDLAAYIKSREADNGSVSR